jgi:ABC-type transporter Mla MlaB component/anti-sigma regulatory factor (Ser/Thr protein kinase)
VASSSIQKVQKQRWARKVFSRYVNSDSRLLRTRKKSFTTHRSKASVCASPSCAKPKTEKFKLAVTTLSVGPFHPEDRAKVLKFFENIRSFLDESKKDNFYGVVLLNLEKVVKVDPSGCAFLFSYIEMFQELYPRVNFKIKYPNRIKPHAGSSTETIQPNHVFNHLELYKQLGSPKAPICHTLPPPKLKIWETESFTNSDSSLVGQILENVCNKVPNVSNEQIAKIYKILIEAVNNCPEHAYDKSFMQEKGLQYKKTRCLFAIIEGRLVVVVADLGVGIRYTLEHGKAKDSWEIFKRFHRLVRRNKDFSFRDSECLQGMINIKNVRERSSRHKDFDNRGYGGVDLQNAIKGLKGRLLIMSGKGSLMLDASNPDLMDVDSKDFDTGLNGTLISMSIPLTVK